jgi:hypothetical protein
MQLLKIIGLALLRAVLRLILDLDDVLTLAFSRLLKTEYEMKGSCKQRGVCCENIGVGLTPLLWNWPKLRYTIGKWYCFVYNFSLVGENEDKRVLVFRCHYLKNKLCSVYNTRPFLCRNYPKPRFFGKPTVLPGCGFYYRKRKDLW